MNDLISVVVPIYNVENYLKNCVDSILKQKYSNIEIILVDDGSDDQCGMICDEYKMVDDRIRVLHKVNGGLSDARNAGIEIAKGKYITFIDSDDYITEDYISKMYELIVKEKADISICKLKVTSKMNENLESKDIKGIEIYSAEEALEQMLYSKQFSTSACGRIFDIRLFDDVKFPIGKYSEDLFTIYKTFLKSKKIVFLNHESYFYYTRIGSITNESFNIKHLNTIEALRIIRNDVVQMYPSLELAYKSSFLEAVARLIKMNIPSEFLFDNGLWNEVKKYRLVVFLDKKSSKRVRGYALLMLCGSRITNVVMTIYYKLKRKV